MIVVIRKVFELVIRIKAPSYLAGGFFIFRNLPLLVEFGIIIDTSNGVAIMRLGYPQMKRGMVVNITHGWSVDTGIKYHRAIIHAILSPSAIVCEVNPREGGCAGSEHSKRRECQAVGFPMHPDKSYHSCSIEMRNFYLATLDKSAISAMLVEMQGD